ncbi:phage portal protein [Sphingomonas sp. 35-24ZXX]|uniref:phage portal protein n=1 Tax=Sphingomonas sp. 35-24ZXX TaxID=1545915 RepID=UPI00053BDE51|nr:phage portal protein [Sphingomonas sp. 35-24ZXX]
MGYWKDLALALKGARGERPPLARAYTSPWSVMLADPPMSYSEQVRAGYCDNPIAQRAVRLVAEGVGGAPLASSDPAIGVLVQATSAGQGLLETLAAHLLLHGNGYVQILRDADGRPAELFALRPDRVSIEPDARGWPAAYVYRVGDSATRLAAQEGDGAPVVVHIKAFHPTDDHYGLGCLGAAARAVAVHNAASRWNQALLDNAARPSGALVYRPDEPGGVLSPDQFDRLKAELEASFAGHANAGRPMLLEGGLSWQSMALSPADMDFVALKSNAAREIALAFGVPPMLLGLPGDNTYANYREANRALWRLTLLPLADKITAGIAQGLQHWWPDAAIGVDQDRVPALSEDRERLWAQVGAADFLSPEEKRAMLGITKS